MISSRNLSEPLEHFERKAGKASSSTTGRKQTQPEPGAAKKSDRDSLFRLRELCRKDLLGISAKRGISLRPPKATLIQ